VAGRGNLGGGCDLVVAKLNQSTASLLEVGRLDLDQRQTLDVKETSHNLLYVTDTGAVGHFGDLQLDRRALRRPRGLVLLRVVRVGALAFGRRAPHAVDYFLGCLAARRHTAGAAAGVQEVGTNPRSRVGSEDVVAVVALDSLALVIRPSHRHHMVPQRARRRRHGKVLGHSLMTLFNRILTVFNRSERFYRSERFL
jgi:hypothetical protein